MPNLYIWLDYHYIDCWHELRCQLFRTVFIQEVCNVMTNTAVLSTSDKASISTGPCHIEAESMLPFLCLN